MRFLRDFLSATVAALLILAFNGTAQAQFEPNLKKGIDDATTIVVGRLDRYLAEPESIDRYVMDNLKARSAIIGGNAEAQVLGAVQPRGTYVFSVQAAIKGKPPEPLMVRLPAVSAYGGHWIVGELKPQIPLKAPYLLLLSGTAETGYKPTTLAPIPISDKVPLPKALADDAPPEARRGAVVKLLLDSMPDTDIRPSVIHLFSGYVSEDVLKVIKPFVDDPDDDIRADALRCMAENQDVSSIPKIAQGRDALALRKYKTPAAIPYMVELLNDKDQYTRFAAVDVLRQLPPDKSAIPGLIKLLRDPENQNVASGAGRLLVTLIPELGPVPPMAPGRTMDEGFIKRAERWWTDEQAGKHQTTKGERPTTPDTP